MADPLLLSADAVLPMDPALPPVLFNAGIIISGDRILGVGPLDALRSAYGALPGQHHAGVLLPGFVNAHTHLELSYQAAQNLKAASFPDWVAKLITTIPPPDQLDPIIRQAVRQGVAMSLHAGVTTLGDISRQSKITRDELAKLPQTPRVVSFGEVVGLGKMRHRTAELLDAATTLPNSQFPFPHSLFAGISPHAPYTVEAPALRACVRRAIVKHVPICMHLAELAEEAQFLRDLSGPLGREWDLMQKMDILDDLIPRFRGGPIRWAEFCGLLVCDPLNPPPRDLPVLLAHANYVDDAELMQLATAAHTSVAYCPRTHAYFGHPAHRYRDMLDAGINVCLATDSLASNPDLSVLNEAQFVYQAQHAVGGPKSDPMVLLEMITRRGARALGLEQVVGSLFAGKFADCVVLPIDVATGDLPTALAQRIISEAPLPAAVYVAGQKV